ncbi:phenylalanyl-tRNA synthetase beta subunit [Vibrio ishigakensis]|uniref:Phenylalanyl-tRNA synthetase beta subunit n=2 Tax=Vibrio ishigakensis TaxID=1481914 RepID=A0A0B8P130_9VIBR|nr:phenylalanyl-tRNA synthetase beta subunit [Vibrio ishigakensis]GAM70625.1 phenylalanyl-tRNA synthetase beta subunit [Vibrio sp. JCM 19236]GAM73304.1 phenylalanyl-tRNA synthetase beta subunit [Vibrio ishigakensis]
MKIILMIITHTITLGVGFALGIYLLPVLTAPPAPTEQIIRHFDSAQFTANFTKERQDSDFFHWGEGKVNISDSQISFMGELAPGPDYKLYLSPEFVETEAKFNELKSQMVQIGDVKSFTGFSLPVDSSVDIDNYNTVVVWCESFGEFITSAQYK